MKVNCSSMSELEKSLTDFVKKANAKVRRLNGYTLQVGIDDSAKYPNGKSVGEVASIIEFGTSTRAPRAPFRKASSEFSGKWNALLRDTCREALSSNRPNVKKALDEVGAVMANDIKRSISNVGAVDTGKLRDSVSWKVGAKL